MPSLTVFAGPNGSGKSSIIRRVDFAVRENLLDADVIAVGIDPSNPPRAAIQAGREERKNTYASARTSRLKPRYPEVGRQA